MSDIAALQKHLCPACGAEANWNAARHALVCPFCGTVSPVELASDGTTIKEHDLVTALRNIPQEKRGFADERAAVQCQSCKAISLFDPARVAQRCEFCGSPKIMPYTASRSSIYPESVLPFRQSESQIREQVRTWYKGRWFAPNRLNSAALTDTVHGLYVPYWTFDAQVAAQWTAEAGHYYYETVRRGGKTERVRKVRWEHASGAIDHFFDDQLVPATQGVDAHLLQQVGTFPTESLVPYDPGYVAGWVVEQYQIDLVAAADRARKAMDHEVRAMCSRAVPGDTQRNLQVDADFSGQTFKHILVPIWLVAYNYGHQTYQVVANGVTGRLAGRYPLSWVKIALAVIAVLLAIVIFGYLSD